jgi:hypothetical protein
LVYINLFEEKDEEQTNCIPSGVSRTAEQLEQKN